MSRPISVQHVMEGDKRFVVAHFTDKTPHEYFMSIEVRVDSGGVMLTSGRYDGQIFLPIVALPLIVEAINEQSGQ